MVPPDRKGFQGDPMRRFSFWLILLVLAAGAAGLGWQFLRGPAKAATEAAKEPPPAVPVVAGTAEARDVPITLTGLGAVQAFNTVTVHARVDGQIDRIAFTEGQDVKAGDVLAQIDP